MMNLINVFEFDHEYSHRAPTEGGSSNMNFDTPNQGRVTNYILEKDEQKKYNEFLSVYENGLIIHFKQTPSEITFRTNREFNLQDNGNFLLVSE